MIRFGVIGAGWRAEFYFRIAALLPEFFTLTGVCVRNENRQQEVAATYNVPVFSTVDELMQTAPDFVVSCVNYEGICDMIEVLCEKGIPVLSETPAGANAQQAESLLKAIKPSWKVQVAEQYHLLPEYQAIKKIIDSGILGNINQIYVSLCHGYHAISLIRHYLGVGNLLPAVHSIKTADPLLIYNGREGYFTPKPAVSLRKTAILDYGDKTAIYDFTDEQYFSDIRSQQLIIRGEKGEISNDICTYISGDFPVKFSLQKNYYEGSTVLDSIVGDGKTLYKNPFGKAQLSDDEIAVATCLLKMKNYLETGIPFYSVADAITDAKTAFLL